ncbi:hypothetical protein Z042_23280 [Chania multitudinisentens RB-25]|uniref:Phage protein n=1 Tax=Chania multitudinisentens RB-25 TaxID=1441930 RepID=W0LIM4_9GAMM|nr:DUF1799 domain-containing protein [Chania multitudinisentens]AHG22202.2 hypothetical protein Z042_23280 [Chania multitudinisentens RB-25]
MEVWPCVWPTFQVFRSLATQWRTGMSGVTGLDYNCLPWLMKLHGVEDEATALLDIRIMESVALTLIHHNQ